MQQHEIIQRAWALTEAIEAAVTAQDWTRAAELTASRTPLVMAIEADQPEESLTTIRRIQASMESLMTRAQAAQTMLAAGYRQSMERAKAAGRYQQAARF
ncbi:flagellar protein FliT [Caballeronia sp. Lep1P3]|uniref:flagellar protein FliT n=1 Tax=Caballeronia sp. Lep1P3 TaxID=2878150 RepID=UPI001FD50ADF|nr:flagellar protein FliT [Caballeronia sp. Lep1P3]